MAKRKTPAPAVEPGAPNASSGFRSGYIALIGEPNAGKSTLLNRVLGQKIAIVTTKPQTTRERVLGVCHRPGAQIVFLDTPGYHQSDKVLNRFMIGQARSALADADGVVWIIDAPHELRRFDPVSLAEILEAAGKPTVVALNKIDAIEEKPLLLPLMQRFGELKWIRKVYAVSALHGNGVDDLINGVIELLPEGPAFFPDDAVTDRDLRFLAREIVLEKVFECSRQEVPYSTGVILDSFEEKPQKKLYVIAATIFVERESQKPILIGEGGRMIKRIGETARREMERTFDVRVFLELRVAVDPEWSTREPGLRRMGYSG